MKLIEQIQDIFYDILGYIVPGALALLMLVPILFYKHSFAYYIFEYGPVAALFEINSLITTYHSWFNLILALVVSFLLGHVIHMIPKLWHTMYNKIQSIFRIKKCKERKHTGLSNLFFWKSIKQYVTNFIEKKYEYIDSLERNLLEQLQSKGSETIKTCLYDSPSPEELMHTYATTNARFQNVSSLYSKYHNKAIFFKALQILFKILLVDATVTTLFYGILDFAFMIFSLIMVYPQSQSGFLCYCFIGATQMTILVVKPLLKKVLITLIFYFIYLTFLYESLRHKKLAHKERCLYIAHILEQRES